MQQMKIKIPKNLLFGALFLAFVGTLISSDFLEEIKMERRDHSDVFFQTFASKVESLDEVGLILLIDSLLAVPDSDPSCLKLVQERVLKYYGKNSLEEESPYPADHYYGSWNTMQSHPYSNDLVKGDTSLSLCLTDREMNCGFKNPFHGRLTSPFGWRKGKMHNGVDIALLVGDTVRAAFRGVVRLSRWQGGYGRVVIVRHYNGLETIYAHLSKFLVKEGEHVDPGTPIGKGGKSGNSRGSHLHLETRFKGKAVNPESFIDFQNQKLKGDTLLLKKTSYGYVGYQPGGAYHQIRRGDYMYKIAMEYGVSIEQICKLNGIRRNHFLVVGEKLKVSN